MADYKETDHSIGFQQGQLVENARIVELIEGMKKKFQGISHVMENPRSAELAVSYNQALDDLLSKIRGEEKTLCCNKSLLECKGHVGSQSGIQEETECCECECHCKCRAECEHKHQICEHCHKPRTEETELEFAEEGARFYRDNGGIEPVEETEKEEEYRCAEMGDYCIGHRVGTEKEGASFSGRECTVSIAESMVEAGMFRGIIGCPEHGHHNPYDMAKNRAEETTTPHSPFCSVKNRPNCICLTVPSSKIKTTYEGLDSFKPTTPQFTGQISYRKPELSDSVHPWPRKTITPSESTPQSREQGGDRFRWCSNHHEGCPEDCPLWSQKTNQ